MKLKLSLFMCLMLVQLTLYAQKNSTIGLNIGASIPINDYASKNPENLIAGLAKTGLSISLNYDLQLIKNFGITAMVRMENNSFDANSLASTYNKNIGSNWMVTADEWKSLNFLFGAFYSLPVKETIQINFKGMIGANSLKQPAIFSTATYQGNSYYIDKSEKRGLGFSYLLGAGAKIKLSEEIVIQTGLDYCAAKPEFKDVVYSTNLGTTTPQTGNTKFTTVNITAGIGYNF
nr:outer membrane beta-barrel protein [Pedobacter kyonggii]